MISRRQGFKAFAQLLFSSPLLAGQKQTAGTTEVGPGGEEQLYDLINVFDFAKLAQSKLDPVAWDYMAEGSQDEISLRDNRKAFERIIIRPKILTDVHKIDLSTDLLGQKLDFPIFVCPAGGKNCFFPNGEEEVAKGAAHSKTLMITNGGIDDYLTSGRGPSNWWQVTTGGRFRNRNTMLNFVEKLEGVGAAGICFTVDNMHVSHRERNIRNRLVRRWCETGVPRDADGNLIYKEEDRPWRTGRYPARPTPTWDTVRQLREMTDLSIVIKGVLTAEDTEKCVEYGMSAVVVSNHGARQQDRLGILAQADPGSATEGAQELAIFSKGRAQDPGRVQTYCRWSATSRTSSVTHSTKAATRLAWHEGQKYLVLQENAKSAWCEHC